MGWTLQEIERWMLDEAEARLRWRDWPRGHLAIFHEGVATLRATSAPIVSREAEALMQLLSFASFLSPDGVAVAQPIVLRHEGESVGGPYELDDPTLDTAVLIEHRIQRRGRRMDRGVSITRWVRDGSGIVWEPFEVDGSRKGPWARSLDSVIRKRGARLPEDFGGPPMAAYFLERWGAIIEAAPEAIDRFELEDFGVVAEVTR